MAWSDAAREAAAAARKAAATGRTPRKNPNMPDHMQGRDAQGRSYLAALRDHDRHPDRNPMPNAEDYRTPSNADAARTLASGPKSAPAPVHDFFGSLLEAGRALSRLT